MDAHVDFKIDQVIARDCLQIASGMSPDAAAEQYATVISRRVAALLAGEDGRRIDSYQLDAHNHTVCTFVTDRMRVALRLRAPPSEDEGKPELKATLTGSNPDCEALRDSIEAYVETLLTSRGG